MNKPSNFWTKLFEKHESHPDVTVHRPDIDFGSTWTIVLVGAPLLLLISAIFWYFSTH